MGFIWVCVVVAGRFTACRGVPVRVDLWVVKWCYLVYVFVFVLCLLLVSVFDRYVCLVIVYCLWCLGRWFVGGFWFVACGSRLGVGLFWLVLLCVFGHLFIRLLLIGLVVGGCSRCLDLLIVVGLAVVGLLVCTFGIVWRVAFGVCC